MASWTAREIRITRYQWEIPIYDSAGAPWQQVHEVLGVALKKYREVTDCGGVIPDDAIRVSGDDRALIISFDDARPPF
jgi:hypothetical protein